MKKIFPAFLIACLLSVPLLSFGGPTLDGITLKDTLAVADKNLVLNGFEFRKASVFRKKVYLAALYAEQKTKDSAELLLPKKTKAIALFPLYEISANDSREAWRESLTENCAKPCKDLDGRISLFLKALPEFRKADRHVYVFSENGIRVLVNDREIFSAKDPALASLVLSTWIGEFPPSDELRRGLLGINK